MKNLISIGLTLSCLCFVISISAQQMGVNTSNPHGDAILDVTSSSKGLLVPRMTESARNALSESGLILYNTTKNRFNFNQSGIWTTTPWRESIANNEFYVPDLTKIGIGIDDPDQPLHIYESGAVVMAYSNASVGMTIGMGSDGAFAVGTGTNANSDMMRLEEDGNAGEVSIKGQVGGIVPCGGIIMWNGTSLPDGWVLCNGSNGTPDLVDKFVYGREIGTAGSMGGSNTTTITLTEDQIPGHTHDVGTLTIGNAGNHDHTVNIKRVNSIGGEWGLREGIFTGTNQQLPSSDADPDTHSHTISGETGITGAAHNIDIEVLPSHFTLAYIMKKCD